MFEKYAWITFEQIHGVLFFALFSCFKCVCVHLMKWILVHEKLCHNLFVFCPFNLFFCSFDYFKRACAIPWVPLIWSHIYKCSLSLKHKWHNLNCQVVCSLPVPMISHSYLCADPVLITTTRCIKLNISCRLVVSQINVSNNLSWLKQHVTAGTAKNSSLSLILKKTFH